MDASIIPQALSSVKTAIDIARLIKDAGVSLEKAEIKLKVAELVSALADVKMQLAEVQELVSEREATIKDLRAKINLQKEVVWETPYYWRVTEQGKDGPYCQQCFDKNKELIRLQGNGGGYWACKTCGNNFLDRTYNASAGVIFTTSGRYGDRDY